MELRPPRREDEAAGRRAQALLDRDGFTFNVGLRNDLWDAYLEHLARSQTGEHLRPGHVPATFLYAFVAGELVGRTSIRHSLNDHLLAEGGHIGYGVLPEHRRRGYATEILRRSVEIARDRGVEDVLVTCDDDNLGSIAVIERCGGELDPDWPLQASGDGTAPKRRYWIRSGVPQR